MTTQEAIIADFEDGAEEHERKAKSVAMWNLRVSIPNTGRAHGAESHHAMMRRNLLDVVSHLRGETSEFNTALKRFDPVGIIGDTDVVRRRRG